MSMRGIGDARLRRCWRWGSGSDSNFRKRKEYAPRRNHTALVG
jgi:hypothetical protein